MKPTPPFKNKKGRLVRYGLVCGYTETKPVKTNPELNVTMYMEHGTIHVQRNDWIRVRDTSNPQSASSVWWSGMKMETARSMFNKLVRGETLSDSDSDKE